MELRIYTDTLDRQPLTQWLDNLKDIRARAQIRARLARVAAGNLGDCKPLRDGVQELKIDYGPGYRVYLSKQGPVLVLLLCGSDKGDQDRAIKTAIDYFMPIRLTPKDTIGGSFTRRQTLPVVAAPSFWALTG